MVGGEKPRQLKHSSTAPLNDLPSQKKLQRDFHGRSLFFFFYFKQRADWEHV